MHRSSPEAKIQIPRSVNTSSSLANKNREKKKCDSDCCSSLLWAPASNKATSGCQLTAAPNKEQGTANAARSKSYLLSSKETEFPSPPQGRAHSMRHLQSHSIFYDYFHFPDRQKMVQGKSGFHGHPSSPACAFALHLRSVALPVATVSVTRKSALGLELFPQRGPPAHSHILVRRARGRTCTSATYSNQGEYVQLQRLQQIHCSSRNSLQSFVSSLLQNFRRPGGV